MPLEDSLGSLLHGGKFMLHVHVTPTKGKRGFGGLIGCLCAAQRATDVFCPPKIGVFSKFTGSPAACERKHLRCCLQRQARKMKLFGCLVS